MQTIDPNYGTHTDVLCAVLEVNNKPVLELGSGYFSTPAIHMAMNGKKIKTVTIDHDSNWLKRFSEMQTDWHEFLCLDQDDTIHFFDKNKSGWGIVFIDNSPWAMRSIAVEKYKDSADYIILHDSDYFAFNNIIGRETRKHTDTHPGLREYDTHFKYWIEFCKGDWRPGSPPTLLGSNRKDLKNITVKNMVISNRSINE